MQSNLSFVVLVKTVPLLSLHAFLCSLPVRVGSQKKPWRLLLANGSLQDEFLISLFNHTS